jgi:hypothetical protein
MNWFVGDTANRGENNNSAHPEAPRVPAGPVRGERPDVSTASEQGRRALPSAPGPARLGVAELAHASSKLQTGRPGNDGPVGRSSYSVQVSR